MAIMAGSETVVWGGKMPNAGKSESLRFTSVWMKQADAGKKSPATPTLFPKRRLALTSALN